ncbi:hypothetical protein GCM10007291_40390 [Gemmobacter nanjingensis]|uniref:Helix-turn-helix domain-containing protein n=2 Tax=Gemmobacter nanjingensis TaxID=488454 RepID=A0ABQ3FRC9_9RHOB|nr:hypothetical protein GCM10007291_40390 [Gemmobacter nanjingensis]
MPGATPSLPSNAGQSRSIRLFAGVCGFGVRFIRLSRPPRIAPLKRATLTNPNKTRGGTKLASFLPPSASPPPLGLCAHWSLQDVPDLRGQDQETPMSHLGSMPDPKEKPRTLLVGWISRLDLALELGLSVDTLRRWEAMRTGPPCVRAGRKVYYRRAAVEEWLEEQEQAAPRRRRAGGRR